MFGFGMPQRIKALIEATQVSTFRHAQAEDPVGDEVIVSPKPATSEPSQVTDLRAMGILRAQAAA